MQYIEKDAAFERRFQQVLVNEPSVPETISILRGLREKYEVRPSLSHTYSFPGRSFNTSIFQVHHGVQILDTAVVQAATLAHRYLTSRKLPDSAIDLIDEAAAAVRVARDSQPEEIDKLERQKLQLEVEVQALSKDKEEASKTRLKEAKAEISRIDEELQPLKAAYQGMRLLVSGRPLVKSETSFC
jgi:ATP-dependent Clp protease ATP-binding subunit ClpB